MLYRVECWPVKSSHIQKLKVAEMRMLRWMCGFTRADKEKGRPLPKFGEWDVNDPASAEGFTVIFNKARDEKKTGGKPESPTKADGNRKEGEEPLKPQTVRKSCPPLSNLSFGIFRLDSRLFYYDSMSSGPCAYYNYATAF
ncbi:putative poly(A)-specific ribonuclease PARN-like [Capsicum annuum]|nr:putative poly(A)-specific ribonuclease PARN-like [Capsicum annuum]